MFSWNVIWFLQKESTTVKNFRLSTAQVKFHQNCWEYIKFQLKKKYGVAMSYDTKELCKIWRDLIFCFKNDKTLVNFDLSNKKSKTFALWSLLREVFWRKTDLGFGKWHEEFGKFSSQKLKMSKLVFSWDPFAQSRKCMSYKLTKEL